MNPGTFPRTLSGDFSSKSPCPKNWELFQGTLRTTLDLQIYVLGRSCEELILGICSEKILFKDVEASDVCILVYDLPGRKTLFDYSLTS